MNNINEHWDHSSKIWYLSLFHKLIPEASNLLVRTVTTEEFLRANSMVFEDLWDFSEMWEDIKGKMYFSVLRAEGGNFSSADIALYIRDSKTGLLYSYFAKDLTPSYTGWGWRLKVVTDKIMRERNQH